MMNESYKTADRVLQLEANNLDVEFNKMIDQTVDSMNLPLAANEIKILFKAYLLGHHLRNDTTLGRKIFGIRYCDTNSLGDSSSISLNRCKMVILATFNLILPYLSSKRRALERLLELVRTKGVKIEWLTWDNLSSTVTLMTTINFLVFLQSGKYLSLQERVLGISSIVSAQDRLSMRSVIKIQMELLYRGAIWKVLAEFLTIIVPHIYTQSLNTRISGALSYFTSSSTELSLIEKIRREENTTKCAICLQQPFNPHTIGCRHVFCYYCLNSRHLLTPKDGFSCPSCRYSTSDQSQVRRHLILGNPAMIQ